MKRDQKGAAFLLFFMALIGVVTLTSLINTAMQTKGDVAQQQAAQILDQSKKALLAYLASADLDSSGRRLGELRLFPDLPIAAGSGVDATEPNYDGDAEIAGCATRTWTPGTPVTPVSTSGAAARCIGRLPWRELGISLSSADLGPTSAVVPWLIASPNIATNSACAPDLTPAMLNESYTGYSCGAAQPYPWITVVDALGNVISNRVAFVLIIPGTALAGQVRGAAAAPSSFLDRVTIGAGCPAPCVPGTYDNAQFNQGDSVAPVIIAGRKSDSTTANLAYYGSSYEFNDQVLYVTADEYFSALEIKAKFMASRELMAFKNSRSYFPFAALLADGSASCDTGNRIGRLPITQGSCAAGDFLSMPTWWVDSGWHRYFIYTMSNRCITSNRSCNSPGLTVDTKTDVNALVIAPQVAIVTVPFAPSKSLMQRPKTAGLLSANLNDYLDSVENAGGAVDVFESTQSAPPPNNDRLWIIN